MRWPGCLLIALGLAFPIHAAGPFTFHDISAASVELRDSGQPVFAYNHGMMLKEGAPDQFRRSSYLHPVYAPDGTVLTDDFPKDHFHHRGISWMWPIVKVGAETYDLWAVQGIHDKFVRWIARDTKPGSARLAVENGWFIGDRKAVKEIVDITAHPSYGGRRTLDLVLSFEAVGGPVKIAGTPDERKGYGGFSFRFAPREATAIRTEIGLEPRDTNMVPHPWAELEGRFNGRRASARVDIDTNNPEFPNGWCLRHYGFLGVNYPGLKSYTLAPGTPLVLRYRVTLISSDAPLRK